MALQVEELLHHLCGMIFLINVFRVPGKSEEWVSLIESQVEICHVSFRGVSEDKRLINRGIYSGREGGGAGFNRLSVQIVMIVKNDKLFMTIFFNNLDNFMFVGQRIFFPTRQGRRQGRSEGRRAIAPPGSLVPLFGDINNIAVMGLKPPPKISGPLAAFPRIFFWCSLSL